MLLLWIGSVCLLLAAINGSAHPISEIDCWTMSALGQKQTLVHVRFTPESGHRTPTMWTTKGGRLATVFLYSVLPLALAR
jgi:hypothetical protein